MGGFLSINLEENYKKNEKFLQSMNEIAIERQIQLQNQMAERQKALAIARSRDICLWFTTFYATSAVGLLTGVLVSGEAVVDVKILTRIAILVKRYFWQKHRNGRGTDIYFRRTKRPYLLVPLIPLTFVDLYYWDLAYGNKLHRIRMEAEHIMTHEAELLEMPCDLPTASSIDQGRLDAEERKKIHPPLPKD